MHADPIGSAFASAHATGEAWVRRAAAFVAAQQCVDRATAFFASDDGRALVELAPFALTFFAVLVALWLFSRSRGGPPLRIRDNFATLRALKDNLRKRGFEGCALVVGIDLSKSNVTQGARTYGGMSLHSRTQHGKPVQTPYETAVRAIYDALAEFDDDGSIPLYGFGDATTKDTAVFALNGDEAEPGVKGVDAAVALYHKTLTEVALSGPTSLVPIIDKATALAAEDRSFHLLLIVTDGDISDKRQTIDAVARASKHDLAIVVIGVGDGPFSTLETLDDDVPGREFDNCQFVNLETLRAEHRAGGERFDEFFARAALMELGEQWSYVHQRKLARLNA